MENNFSSDMSTECGNQKEQRRAKLGIESPVLGKEWAEWLEQQGRALSTIRSYRSFLLAVDDNAFYIEHTDDGDHEDFFEDVTTLLDVAKKHYLSDQVVSKIADDMLTHWEQVYKAFVDDIKANSTSFLTPKRASDFGSALNSYITFLKEYVLRTDNVKEEPKPADLETCARTRYDELPFEEEFNGYLLQVRQIAKNPASNYRSWIKRLNREVMSKWEDGSLLQELAERQELTSSHLAWADWLERKVKMNLYRQRRNKLFIANIDPYTFSNMTTAFTAYKMFLYWKYKISIPKAQISEVKENVLTAEGKNMYHVSALDCKQTFYSRLSTQDRISKGKTMVYPIRLIRRIMSDDEENQKWFHDWIYQEIDRIVAVTVAGEISVGDMEEMCFGKSSTIPVEIITKDKVLTMLSHGDDFEGTREMIVPDLSSIEIHHIPEMQELLHNDNLKGLKYLTSLIQGLGDLNPSDYRDRETLNRAYEKWFAVPDEEKDLVVKNIKDDLTNLSQNVRLELISKDYHKRGR